MGGWVVAAFVAGWVMCWSYQKIAGKWSWKDRLVVSAGPVDGAGYVCTARKHAQIAGKNDAESTKLVTEVWNSGKDMTISYEEGRLMFKDGPVRQPMENAQWTIDNEDEMRLAAHNRRDAPLNWTYVSFLLDKQTGVGIYSETYRYLYQKPSLVNYSSLWNCVEDESIPLQERVPVKALPVGINTEQLKQMWVWDGTEYAAFYKTNINFDAGREANRSGVIVSKKDRWEIFFEVKDMDQKKNNPYRLAKGENGWETLIVDGNGAGSGEGIAKLLELDVSKKLWEIKKCFYYTPEKWRDLANLTLSVDDYLSRSPEMKVDEECGGFQITWGP